MEDPRRGRGPCSHPPALDDLDLIAAIDEEADEAVMAHLRTCAACAERAREYGELQYLLRARLYRALCPTSEELAAFQQRMLEGGRRAQLAAHLAECPHCSYELELAAGVLSPLQMPHR